MRIFFCGNCNIKNKYQVKKIMQKNKKTTTTTTKKKTTNQTKKATKNNASNTILEISVHVFCNT